MRSVPVGLLCLYLRSNRVGSSVQFVYYTLLVRGRLSLYCFSIMCHSFINILITIFLGYISFVSVFVTLSNACRNNDAVNFITLAWIINL